MGRGGGRLAPNEPAASRLLCESLVAREALDGLRAEALVARPDVDVDGTLVLERDEDSRAVRREAVTGVHIDPEFRTDELGRCASIKGRDQQLCPLRLLALDDGMTSVGRE